MNTWEEKLEQIEKELSELDTNISKAQKELEKANTELAQNEKTATTFYRTQKSTVIERRNYVLGKND